MIPKEDIQVFGLRLNHIILATMRLLVDECMVSVPKVNPGDTVFWHCNVIYAVEKEHTGSGDSRGKHFSLTPCSTPRDAWS